MRLVAPEVSATLLTAMLLACAPQQASALYLDVTKDGRMFIEGQEVNAAAVKAKAGDKPVILRGAPDMTFAQFTTVMKQLEALHVPVALIGEDS